MVKTSFPLYVLTGILCSIGGEATYAANTVKACMSQSTQEQGVFTTPILPYASESQSHYFAHCFHWRRRWYNWDIFPYYFWQGPYVYLHTSKRNATSTWSIINDTPGVLVAQTPRETKHILPGTREEVPRHGRESFQLYSYYTRERKRIRTYAPCVCVSYYNTQDYLVITIPKICGK